MNELHGKVALVTGGSRGIGAAIALRLAQQGADVVLTYDKAADRAAEVVDQVKSAGRRAVAVQGSAEAAVAAAIDHFGRLDILVNNAAVFAVGGLDELDGAAFDRSMAVNVREPYLASRAAARHMTEGGRIINIGSNVAVRLPFPGFALYATSKSALVGMTKALARDLGGRGVNVNVVHPGPTDTDANPADSPHSGTISGFTALGRYARTEEIAAMVTALAGTAGDYVTGAEIHVDGGFTV